jgi:hypothetical protein
VENWNSTSSPRLIYPITSPTFNMKQACQRGRF